MRTAFRIALALFVAACSSAEGDPRGESALPAAQEQPQQATGELVEQLSVVSALSAKTKCNCYLNSDCSSGESCGGYYDCEVHAKPIDGTCSGGGIGGIGLPNVAMSTALYFDAYSESGAGEGGPPAADLLQEAQAVSLPLRNHRAIQSLVVDAMDLMLGYDMLPLQPRYGSVIRQVPAFLGMRDTAHAQAAATLVRLVRDGIVDAIRSNDPSRVEAPLHAFWAQHPDFKTFHSGRCYLHGHPPEQVPYKTPEECQIAELTGKLRVFLSERRTN